MLGTVYLMCFLGGIALAILRSAFSMLGADTNADFHGEMDGGDLHVDADGEAPGLGLLNLTVISTFVTVFGGAGVLCIYQFHLGGGASLLVSTGASLLSSLAVALLLRAIMKNTQAGSELQSAVGIRAEVVTPIPEGAMGEIAYVAKGARYVSPAREKGGKAVGRGQLVKILDIAGAVCIVEVEAGD